MRGCFGVYDLYVEVFQLSHVSANLKLRNCPLHVTWHIGPQGANLGEVLMGYRCQLFIDKSKKVERTQRRLCLSSLFPESLKLFISVHLRYASDQAFNGYKSYCQHKMLCWDMTGSSVARSHPPTLLEWQAAKMRTNMAVECHFPDGMSSLFVSEDCCCNVC